MGQTAISVTLFAMGKCNIKIVEWIFGVAESIKRVINSDMSKFFTCKTIFTYKILIYHYELGGWWLWREESLKQKPFCVCVIL